MAKCQICGKEYSVCPQCKKINSWKAIADTHECFQIASVLMQYREGIVNAKQAKEDFERIGITTDTDLSYLLEAVARDVKKIIAEGTEKKEKTYTKKKNVED